METTVVSSQQWRQFEQDGYLLLGNLLSAADLTALQQRIDDIMLGKAAIDYQRLLMQIDSDDGQNAGVQSKGFKGATRAYRKIQDLEHDPLFLKYLQRPLFRKVCEHTYGTAVPIAAFRAMFMNKPARKGDPFAVASGSLVAPGPRSAHYYLDRA